MEDKMWLANYLKAYNELLYLSHKEKRSGQEFAAGCRELKKDMDAKQLILASIFELMGTFKVLHEDATRWGDTMACRQLAWEVALEALVRLENETAKSSAIN